MKPRLLSLCLLSLILPAGCSSDRSESTDELREAKPAREQESQTQLVTGDRARELLDGGRRELLEQLEQEYGARVELVIEARSRSVVSITGKFPTRGDTVEQRAIGFLDIYQVLIDPLVPSKEFVLAPQDPSCYESAVVFDRVIEGIPVAGSRMTIHFNAAHEIESVTNGVAPVPSRIVETDPWSIEGARPLQELLPVEGEPTRTKVLVPAPDRSGVVMAEAVGWIDGPNPKEMRPFAAIAINDVAITGKLNVQTSVSQPPVFSVYAPKYLDKDGLPLPEYISYRDIGGAGVNSFPWEHNPVEMTYRFLEEHKSLMRTGAARCQYAPRGVTEDPSAPGVFFVRLQQKYGPLPVFGSELVVMQEGLGKVMSIAGRTLPKIAAATTPSLAVSDALDIVATTLLDGISQEPQYKTAVYEALQQPSKVALGVLPAHKQDPSFGREERLVYEVQRGPYVFYVDTETAQPIGSRSLIANARSVVTDAGGRNELSWPFVTDEIDGLPTGAISPRNSDNAPGRIGGNTGTSINKVRGLYSRLSWDGSDGRGADWVANTNVNFMFTPCQNAFFDGVITHQTFYCLGEAADDVVGHEFTHGVVFASSRLWFADQSGALNEAYADVMGNLIAPDQTAGEWQVGELSTGRGVYRDMKNPGIGHISGFLPRGSTCNLLPWSCDSGFVHANAGIINRAHVMLSDGIPDGSGGFLSSGIGRVKMARLMHLTMTQRLFSDARLNDAAVAERDICEMFVARNVLDLDGNPYTVDDCDQITNAFNQVGLDGTLDTGWQEPTLGFAGSRMRFFSGEATANGCPVTNVVTDLHLITGDLSIDLDPTSALPTATSDFFRTQSISLRVSPTTPPLPLGTTSMFHIVDWTNVFGFEPQHGSRIVAPNCTPPVFTTERTSSVFFHNNIFGAGGANFIGAMASSWGPGCTLRDTNVELLDIAGNTIAGPGKSVTSTVTHWFFGLAINYNMTATINSLPPGGGSGNLVAGVSWGYDIGRGPLRLRLRYKIDRAAGSTCEP